MWLNKNMVTIIIMLQFLDLYINEYKFGNVLFLIATKSD